MLSKKLIVPSLATLLLLHGSIIADDTVQGNSEASIEEHVPVRSREMSSTKREIMERSRGNESAEETPPQTDASPTVQKANNRISSNQNQFMFAPCQMTGPQVNLAAYTYPINCHFLISISDSNRSLEIEDGSHWEVSPTDIYTLLSWRREDNLVITPNKSWLCAYNYFITNKSRRNSYVKANLAVGPMSHGPYSHWIVDIDYFGGHVNLENQMIWCVSPDDGYILKEWGSNDHIIFGKFDSWFSPYDHILINVNMDNYVHARQY